MVTTPQHASPLLYVHRILLTGIWLMQAKAMECGLNRTLQAGPFDDTADFVQRKRNGHEDLSISDAVLDHHRRRFESLIAELEAARESSPLPAHHELEVELDDLVRAERG